MPQKRNDKIVLNGIPKSPSGIKGFDEITHGGLPAGRTSLICGDAGAGKTLFSLEYMIRGAVQYGEPGVIMSFEEKKEDLEVNVASLGFDLKKLQKDGLIFIDYVEIERNEIEETGEYDLDGLFIRLEYAINHIKAKRVMLDTIENLFGGLSNNGILRAELRRLFHWLKNRNVTSVITAERGKETLTRQGLEEYVSDCVIFLDHRIHNQISTRLMRVVKYRGTLHGTNEYPFLIDRDGISVLPVTSLRLDALVTSDRISSGIPSLDVMLGGRGFFRGSSILVSGTAGTGKTSIAASFAHAACKRKERCLYFAFEEAPQQIIRNLRSINIDLEAHIKSGYLQIHADRPTAFGLEMHLVKIHKIVTTFKPKVVILDPITNLVSVGLMSEVKSLLIRLIDFLQAEGITVMFTALNYNTELTVQTDEGVSSLVDAWVLVRDIEANGERNRGVYIMKSRGMEHSNQVREFIIGSDGIVLKDVFLSDGGVLIGSAREEQELNELTGAELRSHSVSRKDREISRKRLVLEAQITSLREEFESKLDELNKSFSDEDLKKEIMERNRQKLAKKRSSISNGNKS